MAKRPKKEHDFNVVAHRVVQQAIGEASEEPSDKDAAAVRRGKARAAKLTPEQRRGIAKKAAAKRWGVPPTPQS